MLTRRSFVTALGSSAILLPGFGGGMVFARTATDRRFVFIIQRGAADGLATLAPVGDPAFAGQRGVLAEDFAQATKHPALSNVAALYGAK
jgi:uncharacterized protein (DUF1501 family)